MKICRDAGIILPTIFLFYYIPVVIEMGFRHYDQIFIPLFNTLYYGVPICTIWIVSVRLVQSYFLFWTASTGTACLLLWHRIEAATNSNLTLKQGGWYLYLEGDMTPYGMVYNFFANPIGVAVLIVTSVLICLMIIAKEPERTYVKIKGQYIPYEVSIHKDATAFYLKHGQTAINQSNWNIKGDPCILNISKVLTQSALFFSTIFLPFISILNFLNSLLSKIIQFLKLKKGER